MKCHINGIAGYGSPEHGLTILGLAPGRDEMRSRMPFTGQSGKLMNAVLQAVGWSRERTYCTNMMCVMPTLKDPTPRELERCAERLHNELVWAKPKLLVVLGALAAERMLKRTIGKVRGAPMWNTDYQCYVMATYHPAAFLHGSYYFISDIVRDFEKIPEVLSWPQNHAHAAIRLEVVTHPTRAQYILNTLPRDRPISLDVETDSHEVDVIDTLRDRLLCLSISDGERTWWFPAEVLIGAKWPMDVQWTYHNAIFDVRILWKHYGVRLPIVHDTLLMSYSIDERGGVHKLKTLAREYCGAGFYETKLSRKDRVYNAKDATYTARLTIHLWRRMERDNVVGLYNNLLIPVQNVLTDAAHRGVYIDPLMMHTLVFDWAPKYNRMQERVMPQLAREYGWPNDNFNPGSSVQVAKLLYDVIGLPLTELGRTTKAEALQQLDHPFVEKLLSYRKYEHIVTAYLGTIDEFMDKSTNRVHGDPMLHGTRTGRPSYRNPPLQTIPRESTMGDDFGRIRKLFAAPNEDYCIIEADYEGAELWTAAAYSNDSHMFSDLESGDFHLRRTILTFHPPDDWVSAYERGEKDNPLYERMNHLRRKSKYVTFGILYDRSARALAAGELKCSVNEAEHYRQVFLNRYVDYVAWTERIRLQAIEEGEIVAMNGRKRRFHVVYGDQAHHNLRQAVNFPIQSTASDNTLDAMVELHPLLKPYDTHIMFPLHDCILFEANRKHLHTTVPLIKECMERPRYPGFPRIPVEIKVGSSWGDAKKMKG